MKEVKKAEGRECPNKKCIAFGKCKLETIEELEKHIETGKYTLMPCGVPVNLFEYPEVNEPEVKIHKMKDILKEEKKGKVEKECPDIKTKGNGKYCADNCHYLNSNYVSISGFSCGKYDTKLKSRDADGNGREHAVRCDECLGSVKVPVEGVGKMADAKGHTDVSVFSMGIEGKNQSKLEMCREKAAQLWCKEKTSGLPMDVNLCEEIAKVYEEYENQIEQLRVQLAGCGVAALGYCRGKDMIEKGSYGYSASLQDCADLYDKYMELKSEKES